MHLRRCLIDRTLAAVAVGGGGGGELKEDEEWVGDCWRREGWGGEADGEVEGRSAVTEIVRARKMKKHQGMEECRKRQGRVPSPGL